MKHTDRWPEFTQVCVWPGTTGGAKDPKGFEAFILEEFGARALFLEEYTTAPDMENGFPVEDTGGRTDLIFAVHQADVGKFAVPRLVAGIRWIEDVLDNENYRGEGSIYPARFVEYRTW